MRSANNDLQNTKAESQDSTGEPVPSQKLWRSHSTAICTNWIAQHNRLATHYCRTRRFDAKHKSTASTKKRKSHLDPSVPLRAQIEPDSAAKRRRLRPSCARANFSPQRNLRLPEKMQCFVQVLTFKSIYDVAIPMRSANNDPQNTSRIARRNTCTLPLVYP